MFCFHFMVNYIFDFYYSINIVNKNPNQIVIGKYCFQIYYKTLEWIFMDF
jgi:hypothetical protein